MVGRHLLLLKRDDHQVTDDGLFMAMVVRNGSLVLFQNNTIFDP